MTQHFFDVRSSAWNYNDPDGISLPDDEAAIAYAAQTIRELKGDDGNEYDAPDLQMLIRNEIGPVRFFIPFNPRKERASARAIGSRI
jgi:uncharacterized protein DUF6894